MKRADKAGMAGMSKLISAGLQKQADEAHLDAEFLAAFSENALPSAERERAIAHLSNCGECREIFFLAQPQTTESQRILSPAPHRAAFVVRWAALAAAVVIIGSGVFISRRELSRHAEFAAKQAPGPQPLAKMAEEKAAEQPQKETEVYGMRSRAKQVTGAESRPALKHMTAKPQTEMRFDANDEVHVSNSPVSTQPENLPMQGRSQAELGSPAANTNPVPPPAPAPSDLMADKAKARAEEMPRNVTESVEVTANETVTVEAEPSAKKDSAAALQNAPAATTGNVAGAFKKIQPPTAQWSLTPTGAVQRSFDQGKTWQQVPVNGSAQKFLAVFSSGTRVWLGGTAGVLYQSTDSGITWTRVTPATTNGQQLTADIVHVDFTDAKNGTVTEANGEVWTTADGGQTWAVTKK